MRAMSPPASPTGSTQPITTSSTSSGVEMVAILDRLQRRRRKMERRRGMQRAVRFAAPARRAHVIVDEGVGHAVSPCGAWPRSGFPFRVSLIGVLMRLLPASRFVVLAQPIPRSATREARERAASQGTCDSTPSCVCGASRAGSSRLPIVTLMRSLANQAIGQRRAAGGAEAALRDVRTGEGRDRAAGDDEIRHRARRAKAMNGAPPAFWHMRQWQMFDAASARASSR